MKRYLIIFFLLLGISKLYSQGAVNSPAVIFQFIEKSPIMYQFSELKDTILPPDRSKNVLENKYRRIVDGDEIFVIEYDDEIFSNELYILGMSLLNSGNYDDAASKFKLLYENFPDFYKALTLQGLCLLKKGNADDALDLLRDAISENFIDFEAHLLLADLYDEMGLIDVAIRHVLFANIINRNNPEINNKRLEIFKKKGFSNVEWFFVPQIKYKASKSDVEMIVKEQYTGYAMAESLWKFDDEYRKTKSDPDAEINLNRTYECISTHAAAVSRFPMYFDTPEGKCFKAALENKMVSEFVYFEIILPDYPAEALKLSETRIHKIANYIINARGEVK
ncbi:MAG: tetratricopeptide repeat protein [Candidatus Kapabacteria bacterium]|nr:tetratricopeptide repeat protein [Ignavibacteriota bacterium]MCW5883644.1 tetratricopeptide repeat protein [Candidatus Kapabacteria bacterium]